jgi:hypothetical protein
LGASKMANQPVKMVSMRVINKEEFDHKFQWAFGVPQDTSINEEDIYERPIGKPESVL